MQDTNKIVSTATDMSRAAYDQLLAQGLSHEAAEIVVKRNFERVSSNANTVLTLEELCKQ